MEGVGDMQWIALMMLAFSVSLDSFGVGLTYGLRSMRLPVKSLLIITGCSAVTLLGAMGIGTVMTHWLSGHSAERIGGVILLMIGVWALYQVFRPEKKDKNRSSSNLLFNMEIRSLGIMIQILQSPTKADMDDSGAITGIEAVFLGLALSLDAFGAGIGAALIGFSPLLTALFVSSMSALFVLVGMKMGHWFAHLEWVNKLSVLPGVLLILLGLWKL